jgi:cyclopropane fatty-acyl-phospholipid synthase-like methyltransferase
MPNYSRSFYNSVTSRAMIASRLVFETLEKNYQPDSIIDIGSGDGIWLKTFADQSGIKRVCAVDLPGSTFKELQNIELEIEFKTIDFETEMLENREPFELAICVEVIEHISTERALALLDWISLNCHAIIFSGATPGQGGTQHINEQKQEYWINKMISRGFIPCDNIRPILSKQKEVPAYYRNNMFFYINSKFLQQPKLLCALQGSLKQESFTYRDCRSKYLKYAQKLLSMVPVYLVSRLAEAKSKLDSNRDHR